MEPRCPTKSTSEEYSPPSIVSKLLSHKFWLVGGNPRSFWSSSKSARFGKVEMVWTYQKEDFRPFPLFENRGFLKLTFTAESETKKGSQTLHEQLWPYGIFPSKYFLWRIRNSWRWRWIFPTNSVEVDHQVSPSSTIPKISERSTIKNASSRETNSGMVKTQVIDISIVFFSKAWGFRQAVSGLCLQTTNPWLLC